ncbi:hypothetical protein [uncultured Tateyamaria sp.]|uniref:hypothetical protein n=1 Tax=uncultured Tateyamaria sp. TaxID=455651 RepID=UPI002607012E|nr:hypothetical protein [uncultured Tateyamaria sp.]
MWRAGLTVAAVLILAACSTERRPDISTQAGLPPIGLASTAVWLEQREGSAPRVRAAQEIPTSEIRSVVSGSAAPGASVTTVASVPSRARPSTRRARGVQAFADICVASIPDVSGLSNRMRAVNLRDFDVPARDRSARSGNEVLVGGIPDGPIRVQTDVNSGGNNRARCGVSTIGANAGTVAQAKADALVASGFGLKQIAPQGRAQQSWQIVGAPGSTTLHVRKNAFGAGAWIVWQ